MEISSSSYNYSDYYTNPKSWQATNQTTLSMNQSQGNDGSQDIKEAIDDPDGTQQIVS